MNTLISGAARRRNAALRGGLLLACTLGAGLAQAQPGATLGGHAHGGNARLTHALLPEVRLGRLAPQHLPCLARDGVVYSNGVDASEASAPSGGMLGGPALQLQTGHVANSGEINSTSGLRVVREQSRVSRVSLLGGLIQADAVEANSFTDENGAQGGSTLLQNLVIAGTPISQQSPPPNTVLTPQNSALPPGLRVVLNEQRVNARGQQVVHGLHVIVQDLAGYSGHIRIARAVTQLREGRPGLRAVAYGLTQHNTAAAQGNGGSQRTGKQNIVRLACRADYKTDTQVRATVPGLVTTGTLVSEVQGDNLPRARALSRVEDVSLLGGLVTADAVTAIVDSHSQGGVAQSSGAESQFVGLRVNGLPIGNVIPELAFGVPPNTRISGAQHEAAICAADPLGTACALAGGLTLWLNRQLCVVDGTRTDPTQCFGQADARMTAMGIQLLVGASNAAAGAQAGTNLRVAVAHSAVGP